MDNERFPWWFSQVCLRADHMRRRFAKLAQLIVCHLLKTLAKLVDIERRQLNFLHRVRPLRHMGQTVSRSVGKAPGVVAFPHRAATMDSARNSGKAQVVDHGLSSDAQVLRNLDWVSPRSERNGVTDWTHTKEPDVTTNAHFRWIRYLVFSVTD